MSDVRLAWALDGRGEVVFASSMVGVDPRDRPRVTCPECDDVVTLKAGERGIITPHVAHRSGAACAATAPETAAHLNAKMRLVRELSARGALRLRSECRMGHHVAGDWHAPAWARAVPELKVDARRPDVALLDEGGAVVGAVEVLHSHRVDRAKALDLAASGVPWVEFRAEDVLAWDGSSALALVNCDRETRRQLAEGCGRCTRYGGAFERPSQERIEANRASIAARQARMDIVRQLESNPPRVNIATGYAISGRFACVGAVVMARGASTKLRPAPVVDSATGAWMAVRHALRLLAASERACAATIWTEVAAVAQLANLPTFVPLHGENSVAWIQGEVFELVAKTGSLVAVAPANLWERRRQHAEIRDVQGAAAQFAAEMEREDDVQRTGT